MIIEFSLENYKSVADLQTLSFVAAKLKSQNKDLENSNLISIDEDFKLIRSAGIYGANGSGKSNIVAGLIAMMIVIRDSMKDDDILAKAIEPYQLDSDKISQPSYFQIQFLLDGKKYRYGFEANSEKVVSEWLMGPAEKNDTKYFTRSGQNIELNKKYFKEGKDLESKTSKTNLFLNVVSAFNGPISRAIKQLFETQINILGGINDSSFRQYTLELLESGDGSAEILRFLNLADTGIEGIRREASEEKRWRSKDRVVTKRRTYGGDGLEGGWHEFDLDVSESEGTKKLFNLSGVIIQSLRQGSLMVIDEFDARLHPLLSRKIVELYNNPELNTKGAQLLFVTHDTNLLDKDLLRRDQIFFAEKDRKGRTNLYSLYDFKGVRNDAAIEKNYIQGKYGAIPYLGDFTRLLDVE
jgi:hypothetical protein